MDWVKLVSGYYLDPSVATLNDDAAEVLFLRSVAYCGSAETGGVVTEAVLPSLVRGYTKTKARRLAGVLCDATPRPLWIPVDGGWQIRSWEAVQADLEALLKRRRSDRSRQAARRVRERTASRDSERDKNRDVSRDTSRDIGRDSHGTERREEKTAAAAAARGSGGVSPRRRRAGLEAEWSIRTLPGAELADEQLIAAVTTLDHLELVEDGLPPSVEILRTKLDSAGLTVRWDDLDADQLASITGLVVIHGDDALVHAAQISRAAHTHPPAYARAWLPVWRSLPDPNKRRLAAVPTPRCTEPGHETEDANHCRSCASEQKAGHR